MNPRNVVFVSSNFILDSVLNEVSTRLREMGHEVIKPEPSESCTTTTYSPDQWPGLFGKVDVIVGSVRSHWPKELLQSAPNLRGVVFPSIGTETIAIADATDLGIIVANGATSENFNSMSEATVMLMLMLLYDVRAAEKLLRHNLTRPVSMTARMAMKKTVGLIGLGRIARGIAHRLHGWNVNLIAYDPFVTQKDAPTNVRLCTLDELLAASDVVSLHAALTPQTRNLIDKQALSRMKPSAFLINTARGGLVDEGALHRALKTGLLAGAALDAFTQEPLSPESPLRSLDNVILTPHIVGHTQEAFKSIPDAILENVNLLLQGKPPLYCCNPEVLPRWFARFGEADGLKRA